MVLILVLCFKGVFCPDADDSNNIFLIGRTVSIIFRMVETGSPMVLFENLESIETPDDYTVIITFSEPIQQLFSLTSNLVLISIPNTSLKEQISKPAQQI